MKVILRILSIAAVAVITKSDVMEFSEVALNELRLTNPQGTRSHATILNSKTTVNFVQKEQDRTENETKFKAVSILHQEAASNAQTFCGIYHGIYLSETDEIYCRVNTFGMKVKGDPSEPQTLRFRLHFSQEGPAPLVLDIPVFEMPSTIVGVSTDRQLKSWARRNEVSLEAPFDSDELVAAQNGSPLKMDMEWLKFLLTYQVSKRTFQSIFQLTQGQLYKVQIYVTRPLLLSKSLISSCLNAIAASNRQDIEAQASTSLTNNPDDFLFSTDDDALSVA